MFCAPVKTLCSAFRYPLYLLKCHVDAYYDEARHYCYADDDLLRARHWYFADDDLLRARHYYYGDDVFRERLKFYGKNYQVVSQWEIAFRGGVLNWFFCLCGSMRTLR